MMSLEIRMANLEDLDAVAKIESVCFPPEEAADAQKIKSRIEKYHGHFLVLTVNQQIVGFINGLVSASPVLTDDMFENADLYDENGSYQMILSLAVLPEFRGKHYGTAMLRHFVNCAFESNLKGVTLTCKPELVKFYEEEGFQNHGKSDSVHGGFEWCEMRIQF